MTQEQLHYRLIWNVNQIETFAKTFLSDLRDDDRLNVLNDGVLVLQLLAREKYLPTGSSSMISGSQALEQKFVKKSNAQHLIRLIQKFETPIGSYVTSTTTSGDDDNDLTVIIPNIALAVYIDLEVKSQLAGLTKLCHNVKQAQDKYCYGNRDASTINALNNLSSQLFNYIHKSSLTQQHTKQKCVDVDIDVKYGVLLNSFIEEIMILPEAKRAFMGAIETRNGFHVIFDTCQLSKPQWKHLGEKLYKFMSKKENEFTKFNRQGKECKDKYISLTSSPCLPVPGTIQGGFYVTLLSSTEHFFTRVRDIEIQLIKEITTQLLDCIHIIDLVTLTLEFLVLPILSF